MRPLDPDVNDPLILYFNLTLHLEIPSTPRAELAILDVVSLAQGHFISHSRVPSFGHTAVAFSCDSHFRCSGAKDWQDAAACVGAKADDC
jgi:hypothetical protein